MLKTKKFLSVLLSLAMIFSIFSVAAYAEDALISEISVDVSIEAGMTYNDYADFIAIKTEGLEYDDDEGSSTVSVYDYETGDFVYDAMEDDVAYDIYIYLKVSDGYAFGDSIKYVTVNGKRTDDFILNSYESDDGTVEYVDIYLYNYKINAEPYTGECVEKAEITIDSDLGGVFFEDYEKYIQVITDTLEFEDNYGDPAVFVYDENYDFVDGQFKLGETYIIIVYLTAKEGHVLSGYLDSYVNGEEVYSYTSDWMPEEDVVVEYVGLEFEITVESDRQFTIFERIANFFRNLFNTIENFFNSLFFPVIIL